MKTIFVSAVLALAVSFLSSCRCESHQRYEAEPVPEEWEFIDKSHAPVVEDTVGVPDGPDEGGTLHRAENPGRRKLAYRKKARGRGR